ncbi:glycosyltransferase [Halopseudomonas sp.]|uniref:glycosyltransferase n=1 Tax=Halopseudomonas sp. TaxID=2901191 RepID=UPI0030038618
MNLKFFAVIVSYNRSSLLERCLESIFNQTVMPCSVVVVDNASTDNTVAMLHDKQWVGSPRFQLLRLSENTGGAGGFGAGMEYAFSQGADWVWMMDDDAVPHPEALEKLMAAVKDVNALYGSLAVCGSETSWITPLTGFENKRTRRAADIPNIGSVEWLPFLGFTISKEVFSKLGLPDAGFFIAADDFEYSLRAQSHGVRRLIVGNSLIEHPRSEVYLVSIFGKEVTCLRLPPWKRYYDTRNRIFIARKYYGFRTITQTLPASFVRLYGTLRYEPYRLQQTWAFIAGCFDGILGFKGRRHSKWYIKP